MVKRTASVGVLAFQGDVAEHCCVLESLGIRPREVRSVRDLSTIDRLIIPGGESTVISRFLWESGIADEIRLRVAPSARHPLAVLGTCAGAIVLAKKVTGLLPPRSLGVMDITIDRNAYGTQMQSFETAIAIIGIRSAVRVAFIRAPRILHAGRGVRTLATHGGHPVLVRQGRLLAATFHPEVCAETALHELFLRLPL